MKKLTNISNYWVVTFLFIAIKLCLHFLTNTNYELHRDEMLYFNMADHLSFGYATVPPVLGFSAFIIKNVFGYSVFGIRLIPALLGAASIFIISKIVRELGGAILALVIASAAFLLSPGFLLFDTLFTPNVFEHFFWLLITYFIFRITRLNKPELWTFTGALLGLAFLNKYSVIFLITAFLIALIFSPHRKLLLNRHFCLAIAVALIIVIPNIAWQYRHNWPVVFHMKELNRTQLVNMSVTNYVVDIISLNLASSLIWLIGLLSLLLIKKEKEYRYIGVASLLIILFFLLMKGKGYYVLGLIPFLFAVGGYTMEKYFRRKLVWVNYIVLFIIVFVSVLALPFGLPILSFDQYSKYQEKTSSFMIYPFYRWEDGQVHHISQVYSDMTGWDELAGYVAKAYYQLSEQEQKNCTIYGERNYGYAGAVHFYGNKYKLPDAITFLESYVLWAPDTIPKGPFIYINTGRSDVEKLYGNVIEIGCVQNPYFRESGLKVYLCRSPLVDVQDVYKKKARVEKKIYGL